jgi:putative hydrolase of the HAD superfamily
MIKVIVFDLWNTLIPTTIDWPFLFSLIKNQQVSLGDYLARYERSTQLKNYKNFSELRKDFLKEFGPDSAVLEAELYEVFTNRLDTICFFPEVVSVLEKLHNDGYKLALLTNTESIAFRKVDKKINVSKYFDFLGLSYKINAIKPDKKMFQTVLKHFKVKESEALMIGDSLRSDILGAQSVGMHNAWINRKGMSFDLANVKPEFELNSLKDINKVLGELNGD